MPQSHWKLIFDANKEASARKLLNQCVSLIERPPLEFNIEPYHKGGYSASLSFSHYEKKDWSHAVLEVIDFGQRLGGSWVILGDIKTDPSGVLDGSDSNNHIRVPGLTWANWELIK